MKTSTTKGWTAIAFAALTLMACKKDNSDPTPEPETPATLENWTIPQLKEKSTAASVTIDEADKYIRVKGIVISDKDGKNIDTKTAVITTSDNGAGLVVNFAVAHSFVLGDEIEIGVSNQKLLQQNGEITLDAVPLDSAKSVATEKTIDARETSIADINTNKRAWNGTLVSINATEYSSTDGKYAGTLTVKEGTDAISSTVLSGATFATKDLLPSISKLTGIVRIIGDAVSIDIRNEEDVVIGDVGRFVEVDLEDLYQKNIVAASNSVRMTYMDGSLLGDNFTDPDKKYLYVFTNNGTPYTNPEFGETNGFDVKKLRTVSITFAGSQVQGTVDDARVNVPSFYFRFASRTLYFDRPFNTATDEIKIGLTLGRYGYPEMPYITSDVYKETGKFITYTFTLPTTVEELVELGYDADRAEGLLKAPYLLFNNLSVGPGRMGAQTFEWIAPILIEKIVFGYQN